MQKKSSGSITRKLGQKEEAQALGNQKRELTIRQRRRLRKDGHYIKKCKLCEKQFKATHFHKKYCSMKCTVKYGNLKQLNNFHRFNKETWELSPHQLICKHCTKKFESKTVTKYCSRSCRQKSSYAINLKSRVRQYLTIEKYLSQRFTDIKSQCLQGLRHAKVKFEMTKGCLHKKWDEQKGLCALTGLQMTHIWQGGFVGTNASVDRIDNRGPYSDLNTRLVCRMANHMKYQMTDRDLLKWCKAIIENSGAEKTRMKQMRWA